MDKHTEMASREAARNAAEDAYFEARPQVDFVERRSAFAAGFDRGWTARDVEVATLKSSMMDLLEILRQWEPDHASAEERQTILRAMYQTGILTDPTETLRNMTEADFVRAHG